MMKRKRLESESCRLLTVLEAALEALKNSEMASHTIGSQNMLQMR